MTETPAVQRPFSAGLLMLGVLIAVVGHAMTFGAAVVAARVVEPSAGGGFEDIAAVAVVFLGGQLLLALACIIASLILVTRGRRDLAAGLLIAWAVGAAGVAVLVIP